jgi:hypothetical protein
MVVKCRSQFLLVVVNVGHKSNITVIDILVIVVLNLHDFIGNAEAIAKLLDAVLSGRIQRLLQWFRCSKADLVKSPI